MEDIRGLISAGLAELGLTGTASPDAPRRMEEYCALMLEQNRVMNLTAITGPRDAAALHMLDSAALLSCPGVPWEGASLLDVGSGAGLPGLALKLLLPRLEVTLLDSQEKRVEWLDKTAGALCAPGLRAVHGRAEELGREAGFRESFDLVTARAVAGLRVLCELCLPFVKVGGRFLAMKGPGCRQEVDAAAQAIAVLGGRLERVWTYQVPGAGVRHAVVVVEKAGPTPEKYPRRWSKIKKTPL